MWENEPISSTELAKICKHRYQWAKSTTFTVIRRLYERGIIENQNSIVCSIVGKDVVQTARLESLIDETFEGDTCQFLSTYLCSSKFTSHELDFLATIIESKPLKN